MEIAQPFVKKNEKDEIVGSKRLNPTLHKPATDEAAKNSQFYEQDRLWNYNFTHGLSVSRVLGDVDFQHSSSMLHKPDIVSQSFEIAKGETPYLIVACDGLTDLNGFLAESKVTIKYKNRDVKHIPGHSSDTQFVADAMREPITNS